MRIVSSLMGFAASALPHALERAAAASTATPAELPGGTPLHRLWVGFRRFGAGPGPGIATPGAVFFKLRSLPVLLDATRERLSSSLPPYFVPGRCAAFFYARGVAIGDGGAPSSQFDRRHLSGRGA